MVRQRRTLKIRILHTISITERTVRHENPDLKPKMRMGEAVPLPSKVDTDEEFDLW